jgi:hypothetical protein
LGCHDPELPTRKLQEIVRKENSKNSNFESEEIFSKSAPEKIRPKKHFFPETGIVFEKQLSGLICFRCSSTQSLFLI